MKYLKRVAALHAAGQVKRVHDGEDLEAAQKRARLHAPEHTNQHTTTTTSAAAAGQQQPHEQGTDHDMHDHEGPGSGDAQHAQQRRGQAKPLAEDHSVFVKNLPYNTGPEALKRFFAECGEIASVRIPQHPNGTRRVSEKHVVHCTAVCLHMLLFWFRTKGAHRFSSGFRRKERTYIL